ncbi:MAG: CapA family protein [Bacteroidales bacterium]|nr:CapA family protein [Bacteroidales bacterium]
MKLFFCGDIMPGGVLPYQDNYISSSLRDYIQSFDFRIGTLEAAIGTGLSFDPVKMSGRQNIIYARNEDFFRIKEMGFDVVSLANNHIWDLGEDGLKNTIRLLKENGIKYCGVGNNIDEASRPAIMEKDGLRVAVLAYCMYGNPWLGYVELAGKEKAGVNPLYIDKVVEDIHNAKEKYDKVIVLPHWGREYQYEPLPECVTLAKKMIDAGADAVLGSHTHQIQPLVEYKGKSICYSMGNFLFPDFYMYPPRPIWYPDSLKEVEGVKDVVGYPYPIEEPIRQVWNPISRYGCIVSLNVEKDGITVKRDYVHSSDDNVVSLSVPEKAVLRGLGKSSLMLTCWPYRSMVRIKRKGRSIIRRIYRRIKQV